MKQFFYLVFVKLQTNFNSFAKLKKKIEKKSEKKAKREKKFGKIDWQMKRLPKLARLMLFIVQSRNLVLSLRFWPLKSEIIQEVQNKYTIGIIIFLGLKLAYNFGIIT